ncbi:MAG: BMP family lipoprotein [Fimbriimonas sp.]
MGLIGCSGGGDKSTPEPQTKSEAPKTEATKGLKVGVVFDSGGRGDKSFNDSAYAGIEKATKDLGIESKTVDSRSEKDYETNLSALADEGLDVIFAVGITQANALKAVAPKYPTTKFAIIDGDVAGENVRSLQFAENEGSFLAGFAAGLATKTNKIGFVGGMSIPLIKKFEAGYIAGAKAANPKVEALPSKYTENWNDTGLGKAAAQTLFAGGADVVYHAAGRCGIGVITAAREAGKLAIGVDSDQDDIAKGFVLTSMIKRVDEAVYQTIKDVKDGNFTSGVKSYDLKSNGVGLSDFRNTKDKIGPDGLKKLDDIKAKLISGQIKAPASLEELNKK